MKRLIAPFVLLLTPALLTPALLAQAPANPPAPTAPAAQAATPAGRAGTEAPAGAPAAAPGAPAARGGRGGGGGPQPAQTWALARLEGKSPRHQEWVKVPTATRPLNAFVTYPERPDKATIVIVIHENMGLNDWARSMTDQLAEAGYIAIAPDMVTQADGRGARELAAAPAGGLTPGQANSALTPDGITADLNAVVEYAKKIPAGNGKIVVSGFCWGGAQSFRFATNNKDIKATFSFYGAQPSSAEDVARIVGPVYGFYAANDMRVNATIQATTELMKAAGKTYEPVIFDEGSGHGFMRGGDPLNPDATAPNRAARDNAWKRWMELLAKI